MRFKDLRPKYEDLDIYIEKESLNLLSVPQKMKFEFAKSMFENRKVLFSEDHDDKKITEVLLESDADYEKRKKFES